eukprot:3683504-Amphidinium_carterae.1
MERPRHDLQNDCDLSFKFLTLLLLTSHGHQQALGHWPGSNHPRHFPQTPRHRSLTGLSHSCVPSRMLTACNTLLILSRNEEDLAPSPLRTSCSACHARDH